ncbi:unnamed protein product [Dicrocoelium dendriticum]|nr:unnamed protein product [Dicrocoelium dendriticum]
MDLYYLEKCRSYVLSDHSYAQSSSLADAMDNDETILINEPSLGVPCDSNSWIDIGDASCQPWLIPSGVSLESHSKDFCSPSPFRDEYRTNHTNWIVSRTAIRNKILRLLEKCVLQESTDNSRFTDLSDTACLQRRRATRQLRLRRIARGLRKAFASFAWGLENCFSLHHWCLTRLTPELLRMYCDGFIELWNQNKVRALLIELNRMFMDREPLSLRASPGSPLHGLLGTTSDFVAAPNRLHSIMSGLTTRSASNSSTAAFRRLGCSENVSDLPILACLTFPAHPSSSRLCYILNELNSVGRVSLESPEEHACEMMRLRLRLYIRRVLALLEDPKRYPVYLVGFGIGCILILLALLHMQSMDIRGERPRITGVICIGMPLIGLKGARGCSTDPLLGLPELPMLFIIGSKSRLGGQKQMSYFRNQLILAQQRARESSSDFDRTDGIRPHVSTILNSGRVIVPDNTSRSWRNSSLIQVTTVGGADHLLRLRPSSCARRCLTQELVDKRMVASVERFIHRNERWFQFPLTEYTTSESDASNSPFELNRPQHSTAMYNSTGRNSSPQLFPLSTPILPITDGSGQSHLLNNRKMYSYGRQDQQGCAQTRHVGLRPD